MTDFEFGDVVLVPFPFTDQSSIKKRPAVVVSSAIYNRDRPDIIILVVTSQIAVPSQIRTFLVQDWKAAGLLKPSVVKPIITTLQKIISEEKTWPFGQLRYSVSLKRFKEYLRRPFLGILTISTPFL